MPRFPFICLSLLFVATAVSAPVIGKPCPFKLVDVDGRTLSNSDGVVTLLVLASRRDADKARLVGNRVPERCLGVPASRLVTVVRFQSMRTRTLQVFFSSLMRRKLDDEAKGLQAKYTAKGLKRNARQDIYAVADFDGRAASELGLPAGSIDFRVLVTSADGTLLRDWSSVPSADELSKALP